MKEFVKLAVVGLAGYFIGFYEMKYNVVKAIAEVSLNATSNDNEEGTEGS